MDDESILVAEEVEDTEINRPNIRLLACGFLIVCLFIYLVIVIILRIKDVNKEGY